jgi:hypothetical protein
LGTAFGTKSMAFISGCAIKKLYQGAGGAGGIRTLDRALQPYNGLANRRLQPLGHSSVAADMPEAGTSRKQQIPDRLIPLRIESSACRDLAQG